MKLFSCSNSQPITTPVTAAIPMPLGIVRLEATIEAEEIAKGNPSETYQLSDRATIGCWRRETFDLELLLYEAPLPARWQEAGYSVTGCRAGVWRLEAHTLLCSCLFSATWQDDYLWQEASADCGQYLYAWTSNDSQWWVSIGTQDTDRLAQRAQQGDYLPKEWADYFEAETIHSTFWARNAHQELRGSGLAIPIPALEPGQRCQIHFVIGWGENNEQSAEPWMAVDREGTELLAEIACL